MEWPLRMTIGLPRAIVVDNGSKRVEPPVERVGEATARPTTGVRIGGRLLLNRYLASTQEQSLSASNWSRVSSLPPPVLADQEFESQMGLTPGAV